MKIICDGLDLSDAVLKVSKALSVKSSNPILEGIKLTAKGDCLTLFATDMELSIERKIKADVLMEGETVVVGKYFVDFTKKLEKEQVELSRLFDGGLQNTIPADVLRKLGCDAVVSVETLIDTGIVKNPRDGVKILGNGTLTKKLTVQANAFNASAVEKIEALGGKAEVI